MTALTRTQTTPAVIEPQQLITNLRQHAAAARGAYARNTGRARQADVAIFTGRCVYEGRQALPALPETVAAFIDAMAASKAPATIRRRQAGISTSTAHEYEQLTGGREEQAQASAAALA